MWDEPHRCEKLLLALIMANERKNWPKAVTARPAKPNKNLLSPVGGGLWGQGSMSERALTEEEEAAHMLPSTVLGREEGIFEDVLEHAGEVSERVLPPIVEQVGWIRLDDVS